MPSDVIRGQGQVSEQILLEPKALG